MNNFYAVILAGGQGTRLWPLSRRKKPKQLHSLMTEEPMIKDTYSRLLPVFDADKIIISTIPEFVADIRKILPDIPKKNYIVEPSLMGNAAACGLVSELLYARDNDSVAFFMPADAFIANQKEFQKVISFAEDTINTNPKQILTIGIKPNRPETGYGYIKTTGMSSLQKQGSSTLDSGSQASVRNDKISHLEAHKVECFVEKPDQKTAEKYFTSGKYLWNSGIFGWRTDHILELFEKFLPDTFTHLENIRLAGKQKNFDSILNAEYAKVEKTTIDYGIIEKTKDILVIPADFGWSDVGSWGSLLEVLTDLNKTDSVHRGNHIGVDNTNCLIMGGKKLIATIGLENIVVVDTPDALLICHKDQSHKVKEVLNKLEDKLL